MNQEAPTIHATNEADLAPLLRAQDYDRFLCVQLAPPTKRPALYALGAFHAELARIAEVVSESLLGHIRLAWWREALDEIVAGKAPRNHPVVLAVAEVYGDYPSVFPLLYAMIEARAADLDPSLLETREAWFAYLDGTAGALHRAWAVVLDVGQVGETVALQARAYAAVGLVRAIPYQAQHGLCRFPGNMITDLAPGPQLQSEVGRVLAQAVEWLHSLISNSSLALPLPLRGLQSLTKFYIGGLQKNHGDPYGFSPSPLRVLWVILALKILRR